MKCSAIIVVIFLHFFSKTKINSRETTQKIDKSQKVCVQYENQLDPVTKTEKIPKHSDIGLFINLNQKIRERSKLNSQITVTSNKLIRIIFQPQNRTSASQIICQPTDLSGINKTEPIANVEIRHYGSNYFGSDDWHVKKLKILVIFCEMTRFIFDLSEDQRHFDRITGKINQKMFNLKSKDPEYFRNSGVCLENRKYPVFGYYFTLTQSGYNFGFLPNDIHKRSFILLDPYRKVGIEGGTKPLFQRIGPATAFNDQGYELEFKLRIKDPGKSNWNRPILSITGVIDVILKKHSLTVLEIKTKELVQEFWLDDKNGFFHHVFIKVFMDNTGMTSQSSSKSHYKMQLKIDHMVDEDWEVHLTEDEDRPLENSEVSEILIGSKNYKIAGDQTDIIVYDVIYRPSTTFFGEEEEYHNNSRDPSKNKKIIYKKSKMLYKRVKYLKNGYELSFTFKIASPGHYPDRKNQWRSVAYIGNHISQRFPAIFLRGGSNYNLVVCTGSIFDEKCMDDIDLEEIFKFSDPTFCMEHDFRLIVYYQGKLELMKVFIDGVMIGDDASPAILTRNNDSNDIIQPLYFFGPYNDPFPGYIKNVGYEPVDYTKNEVLPEDQQFDDWIAASGLLLRKTWLILEPYEIGFSIKLNNYGEINSKRPIFQISNLLSIFFTKNTKYGISIKVYDDTINKKSIMSFINTNWVNGEIHEFKLQMFFEHISGEPKMRVLLDGVASKFYPGLMWLEEALVNLILGDDRKSSSANFELSQIYYRRLYPEINFQNSPIPMTPVLKNAFKTLWAPTKDTTHCQGLCCFGCDHKNSMEILESEKNAKLKLLSRKNKNCLNFEIHRHPFDEVSTISMIVIDKESINKLEQKDNNYFTISHNNMTIKYLTDTILVKYNPILDNQIYYNQVLNDGFIFTPRYGGTLLWASDSDIVDQFDLFGNGWMGTSANIYRDDKKLTIFAKKLDHSGEVRFPFGLRIDQILAGSFFFKISC